MKPTRIVITLVVTVSIAIAVWVWRMGVQKRLDAENQATVSIEGNSGNSLESIVEASPKPERKEERFSMVFRPNGSSENQGSITVRKEAGSDYMVFSAERPGDYLMFTLRGETILGTGEGSEFRFVGTIEITNGVVSGERSSRLAFRKVDGDWAYVSGLGQYEEEGKVTKLGHNRTVESCLDLLKSKDPILREGGARDLGRLTTANDAGRVVPQLIAMLKDHSDPIRRGAIEGLGLIGTAAAAAALQAAYAEEKDKTTKEYYEEALGFCAAYSISGEPGAPVEPPEVGLDRLLRKASKGQKSSSDSKKELSDWETDNLVRRVAGHQQQALVVLNKAATSSNPKIAQSAALIKKALQAPEKEKKL